MKANDVDEITKFSLLKRRSDLSWARFAEHWHGTHARVLQRAGHAEYNADYVQNHFSHPAGSADRRHFDGAAQMRQRPDSRVTAGFQEDSRYLEQVRPDEALFLDVAASVVLFTKSTHHVGPTRDGCKLMIFGRWHPDLGPVAGEAMLRDWMRRLLAQGPAGALTSLTHHVVLEGATRGLATTAFDDVNRPAEHFDVVVEMRSALARDRMTLHDALLADWPAAIDRDAAFLTFSDEKRIY
ncbi:EthD domain-containing protein [Variovorax sp. KK3]|uniref:EthD domain-containing protein n=1 Tax=Variovorax sp. KK3 TaxID=1855728 RepID=UPI00097C1C8D|nr:EthD domain-containing protein [Variovorax sp. KK3]